jgi:hypothetical protein
MNTEYGTPNFCGGEDFLYLILVPMKKGEEEKKNLGGMPTWACFPPQESGISVDVNNWEKYK